MHVNMDHLRWQMTGALNHLGRDLVALLTTLPEHERETWWPRFVSWQAIPAG